MTTQTQLSIPYKDKVMPAVINSSSLKKSDLSEKLWIVLTHGAGGDLKSPQLTAIANYLADKGLVVLRFTCKGLNINYRVRVFSEVLNFLHTTYAPKGIFLGGRSMGARAAAILCSDTKVFGDVLMTKNILGVICLSYPLHKPKFTSDLRDEPLKKLRKPIFFLSGTKDEMCDRSVLDGVLRSMKSPYKVHWLEGCNHSAKPTHSYQEDMYLKAFQEVSRWCVCIAESELCIL